jgi:hypothetical protein
MDTAILTEIRMSPKPVREFILQTPEIFANAHEYPLPSSESITQIAPRICDNGYSRNTFGKQRASQMLATRLKLRNCWSEQWFSCAMIQGLIGESLKNYAVHMSDWADQVMRLGYGRS